MKKVLFATTALIATASVAAADVRLSGYGRFGLDYNDRNSNDVASADYNGISETSITSRLRLQFDMSTETDGGVGFNARFRAQAESRDNTPNGATFNGARFGVTYGGLTVNVGNIIGAVENSPGLYTTGTRSAGTGIDGMGFNSLALGNSFNWDAYSSAGAGANGVEALYTVGGFTGHISYSEDNDTIASAGNADPTVGPYAVATAGALGEDRAAVMLTYAFGDYYVTGSYQSSSDGPRSDQGGELNDGLYFLAAGGDWGQFGAKLAYGSTEEADRVNLEGNVDIGAASNILVWVTNTDRNAGVTVGGNNTVADGTAWGINYQYDLGGGATFVAGYVDSQYVNAANVDTDQQQFQAGVYFSF